MKKLIVFLSFIMFCHVLKSQNNVFFPPDANVLDVTKAPFFADNTGTADVTAIIQAALDSAGFSGTKINVVYLPNGIYLVSDELRWANKQTRDVLQGQSTAGTIIKLANGAAGYGSLATPKAVIWTGKAPAQRFHNSIRNLTVNTGSGNAGAIGIKFMANNQGGMEKVLIKSDDGGGVIGLDLGHSDEQGPCLIKDVKVIGFDMGIRTKFGVDGVVLSNIILENQDEYALHNEGQCISIENLQTKGSVPGFVNIGTGVAAIINSTFHGTGAASGQPAIINGNGLFARNITTTGYLKAIDNSGSGTGRLINDVDIEEFVSHEPISQFTSPPKSLNLAIEQTPEIQLDPLSEWVSVQDYLPKDTVLDNKVIKDWTPAIQQAIDAGKSTVYFPQGTIYQFFGTVYVRGNVKRIIGIDSEIREYGPHNGTLEILEGTSPVVIIEKFDAHYAQWKMIHKGNRVLVLKNLWMDRLTIEPGAGNVFLEDVRVDRVKIPAGQNVLPGSSIWKVQIIHVKWISREIFGCLASKRKMMKQWFIQSAVAKQKLLEDLYMPTKPPIPTRSCLSMMKALHFPQQ